MSLRNQIPIRVFTAALALTAGMPASGQMHVEPSPGGVTLGQTDCSAENYLGETMLLAKVCRTIYKNQTPHGQKPLVYVAGSVANQSPRRSHFLIRMEIVAGNQSLKCMFNQNINPNKTSYCAGGMVVNSAAGIPKMHVVWDFHSGDIPSS